MFISYAQNFEDVLLNRVFKDKENGFYIDVGAQHPVFDSVTKSFYDRGWHGINIEPVKEFFELLEQQRPRDINLNIAMSNCREELEFFELEGTEFSSLSGKLATKLAQERGLILITYNVPTRTLADVCRDHAKCQIDFLKIDVEGWEESVIRGNDWEIFRPTIVLVEATLPGSPLRKLTDIPRFLDEKGYQHIYFDGLNDYYLAQEARTFCSHFSTPPNVFDNFTLFRTVNLQEHADNLQGILQERVVHIDSLKSEIENFNQLLQERDFETKRLKSEIENLTNELERKNLHLSSFRNIVVDKEYEIKRLGQELLKLQALNHESSDQYQEILTQLQNELSNCQKQLEQIRDRTLQSEERISAMETSKFWKMRKGWFRLRKRLGKSGD